MPAPEPLDAPEPTLSAAEERFDLRRRTAGLVLGPVAFALAWLAPIEALTPEAHRLAAIVALVVVWWIAEAIPLAITAIIGPALAVATGVAPAQQAFAPFASPTVFLFIGSFMLGAAVTYHGLDRRLAEGLLALPAIGRSPGRILLGVGIMTIAITGLIPIGRMFSTGILLDAVGLVVVIGGLLVPAPLVV